MNDVIKFVIVQTISILFACGYLYYISNGNLYTLPLGLPMGVLLTFWYYVVTDETNK